MELIERFELLKKNGRLSHLYLLNGEIIEDLEDTAFKIISVVYGRELPQGRTLNDEEMPINIRLIRPAGNVIKKEQIIELEKEYMSHAFIDTLPRIFVLSGIDKISVSAANSLLKFLEEPNNDIYGFLLTTNLDSVLPTIKSRSQILNIKTVIEEDLYQNLINLNFEEEKASIVANIFSNNKESGILVLNDVDFNYAFDIFKLIKNEFVNGKNDFVYLKYLHKISLNYKSYDYLLTMLFTYFNDIIFLKKGINVKLYTYFEEYKGIINQKIKNIVKYNECITNNCNLIASSANIDLLFTAFLIQLGEI
ncbi:MAG: hypothetical protein LBV58_01995 [Acholeplasmatales bacterium]|jgi:DNA polymerase-3 subunit delta'|nr:hypothetical protein [Acholeplasmatales bacterium]